MTALFPKGVLQVQSRSDLPGAADAASAGACKHTMPAAGVSGKGASPPAGRGRRVVDAPVRMFHWLFALSFQGAYLSADGERWRALHPGLGWQFAGLLVLRLVDGLVGPRQARLSAPWARMAGGAACLRAAWPQRSPAWRQGQNLLLAATIASLLVAAVPLALTGIATWQAWPGADWLEEVHEFLGQAMLALAGMHLGLLLGFSLLRRSNLAWPMVTGRLAGAGPGAGQSRMVGRGDGGGVLRMVVGLDVKAWARTASVPKSRTEKPLRGPGFAKVSTAHRCSL